MRINIDFAQSYSIIEFEPFMGTDIQDYIKEFEEWYYEPIKTEFGYTYAQRIDLKYKIFDAQVVVDWMNEVCPTCNAIVVQQGLMIKDKDETLQSMYF